MPGKVLEEYLQNLEKVKGWKIGRYDQTPSLEDVPLHLQKNNPLVACLNAVELTTTKEKKRHLEERECHLEEHEWHFDIA